MVTGQSPRALARIEAGTSHGLVVAKLDRFGRSLIDGLAAIERIQRAGGTFVSVQDGFDLTTETGRLIMRIMLAMGEWPLDRIRSVWPRRVEVRRLKRKVNSFRLSRLSKSDPSAPVEKWTT